MKTSDSIKIAILSYHFSDNSENRNSRPLLIYQAIKEYNPNTEITVYCSAFDHIKKAFIEFDDEDL